MFRIARFCAMIAVLAVFVGSFASAAAKKAVKAKPVTKAATTAAAKPPAVVIPTGPKYMKVVVGQPFEAIPATGPSKLTVTMCAEQTAPSTFSVVFGKPLDVIVSGAELVGPGKIAKENVKVKLVKGNDLLPANNIEIGPAASLFWVDVTVPKGTKPGLYKGYINFSYQDKQWDVVPLDVNVIPMRLIGSSKQYALYTSLSPFGEGASALDTDSYANFVQAIADMGFRAVAISAMPENIGDVLRVCSSAGLVGGTPVLAFASGCDMPTVEQIRAVETAKRTAGIPTIFQFCANNPCSEEETAAAVEKARLMRQSGCQVAATVSDTETAEKLLPVCHALNYNIDMPYVQALINGGSERTNKWEWYWWDARREVHENRMNSGIALWRSGLYGCMPFWMPKDETDFPERLDSLLTMAMREGVTDTRFITTYMKALRELKDKKREADKDYIAATEAYLAAFMIKPMDKLTPTDLMGFRAKMIEFTNKLEARL